MSRIRQNIRIALGSCAVEVENHSKALAPALEFLLKDTASEGGEVQTTFVLDSISKDKSFTVSRNGSIRHRADSPGRVCTYLIGEIIYHLIDNNASEILIHAACVAKNGLGILLPGVSGAGKSTLCAWLLTKGFEYLTDEIISLDPTDLSVQALARPLNIKRAGMVAIQNAKLGGIENAEILDGANSHLVEHRAFNPGFRQQSVPIGVIVFPRYQNSADFKLSPTSNAKTAMLLMQAYVNARNHTEHGIGDITRFVRRLKGFELTYSDFDQLGELEAMLNEISENPPSA